MLQTKSLRTTIPMALAVVALLTYNFMSAEWNPAPANPPNSNTPAPINVGTTTQNKTGDLGVVQLRAGRYCSADGANCSFTVGGSGIDGAITSAAPTLSLRDNAIGTNPWDNAGTRDFQIHVNGNYFYVLVDRDDDGYLYEPEDASSGWPMQISTGNTSAEDYVVFSNQVRANAYCDRNGENCLTPSEDNPDDTIIVGGKCFKPANLVTCNWNWSGDGNDDSSFLVPLSDDPVAFCSSGSSNRTYRRHSMTLAECESTYFRWSVSDWGGCSAQGQECGGGEWGTQNRSITCVNGPGQVVPDANCASAGPKPATTQACYSPGWRNSGCR